MSSATFAQEPPPKPGESLAAPASATDDNAASDRRGPLRPERLVSTRARLQGRTVGRLFQLGDALALLALAATPLALGASIATTGLHLVCAGGLLVTLRLSRTYEFARRETLPGHLLRTALALAVAGGVVALALTALSFPLQRLGGWGAAVAVATLLLHAFWWTVIRRGRASGRLTPNLVVVGATGAAERMITTALASREVNVLGVFDDRAARAPKAIGGVPVLGDTRTLVDHRIMPYVDRIVITVPAQARARVRDLIAQLRVLPNEISLLLDGETPEYEAAALSRLADVPLAHISGPPADQGRALVKRTADIVLTLLALIPAAPLMALIALAVRLDSPGPALFRQRRHGFNNEEIVVWKFRSMRVEAADATASRQVQADDDRVTRIGRFIRMTSLDELPQLLNVLRGEMSLVGPRPHAVGMKTGDVESARLVAEYAHRHRMKPGLTGWAAIQGSRGPVDTPEAVRRRVALDVEYIERQSFWFDLYIMAMTLPCLLGDRKAVR